MLANGVVMHADKNEVIPSSVIDSSCGSVTISYISHAIGIGVTGDTGAEKHLRLSSRKCIDRSASSRAYSD